MCSLQLFRPDTGNSLTCPSFVGCCNQHIFLLQRCPLKEVSLNEISRKNYSCGVPLKTANVLGMPATMDQVNDVRDRREFI